MARSYLAAVTAASSLLCASAVHAAVYRITPIGLVDAEHTRVSGYRSSAVSSANAAGAVMGTANRYNGTSTLLGQSVWLYDGINTRNVGLVGAEHTRSDGYRWSEAGVLTASGAATGSSRRYSGMSDKGVSAWYYDGSTTVELGFSEGVHTAPTGYRESYVTGSGSVIPAVGYSQRYSSTGSSLGRSVWAYTGTTTVNIGMTGARYTSSSGYRSSSILATNAAGQAAGLSARYTSNGANLGGTAWLYNGTDTLEIGLPGGTASNGYRESSITRMNDAGQVLGWSERYKAYIQVGSAAWLYNGSQTVELGFTDAEHTRITDGRRYSSGVLLNAAGHAAGTSSRYANDGADQGKSAWLYNGTGTVKIGLTDAEHTGMSGHKTSSVSQMNSAGQVIGSSIQSNGGQSAWLYNGSATVRLGLIGAEHTADDGDQTNEARFLTESGKVGGIANRYNGTANLLGTSAWLYDGTNTVQVGLTGARHTRGDDYRQSDILSINEAGDVVGHSARFVGGSSAGASAWLYRDGVTRAIGLTGDAYTRTTGYHDSIAKFLNAAGQVAGYSTRRDGGTSAWFYDPVLDEAFNLDMSVRSDGRAASDVAYLGDDGLVLGYYTLYDDNDALLGQRAFAFTLMDGPQDLGALIDGGLNTAGWASLATAWRANDLDQIIGSGLLFGMPGGTMPYVLTPVSAVPVPGTVWLLGSGLIGLIAAARRRAAA